MWSTQPAYTDYKMVQLWNKKHGRYYLKKYSNRDME
jgi:hypothetical protein